MPINKNGEVRSSAPKIKRILNLSITLAKAGFKLKNEGTYLGVVWYLINPLLTYFLLFFVFSQKLGSEISFYAPYLFLGVVMFNYFRKSTTESVKVIYEKRYLIKSIRFPRISLTISVVLKNLYSHFFEFGLIILFLLLYKIPLSNAVLYLLVLIPFTIFILGVSLMLSALTVYIIDIENLWFVASRLLWLATPIFYSIEEIYHLKSYALLNPVNSFIHIARDVLIYSNHPQQIHLISAVFYAFSFFTVGVYTFLKLENKFSEKM